MNTLSALTVIYGTGYDRQKNNRSKSGFGARVSLKIKAYHDDLNIFYFQANQ